VVHLDRRAGKELLVGDVDRSDAALGELWFRRLERALEILEPLVDHLDIGSRGYDELDLETSELLEVSQGSAVERVRNRQRDGFSYL
jgi:hypothetical protein